MRNLKKAGILTAITVVLAGIAYLGSAGYFHLGWLSSSVIRWGDTCSEASQNKKKSTYDLFVKQRDTAQVKIDSYNGEIAILEGSKAGPNADKAKAEADIGTATSAKTTAETFIKNNCTPKPKNAGLKTQCDMNKTNLATANSNLSKAKVAKSRVELKIAQIDAKITAKKNAIKLQEKTRDRNKAYIEAYEECENQLGVKFYPACSFLFHTLGLDINTPCENESSKVFQGYPFGQAWIEYRFILKGSEIKDVPVRSVTFFLGDTDEQKIKLNNIRLSTGIEANDVIAKCERVGDSIQCTLNSPIILKKQDVVYWYLNANIDVVEDHTFTVDIGGVNVWEKYDTKNKNQNTKFIVRAYSKSPFTGDPGNFNVWETKKEQTIKLGNGSQTIYEFQVKAEDWQAVMTDVILWSEYLESLGQSPEQFISCADPRLRNQLFYGVLELYDGSQLIATSEDYAQTYTKFDIKNPILIKSNTEKKFTVKANMQSNGLGTQCSFSVIPNILGNTGSFSTHESNYITTIKGTDASQFRFSSWTCYNGEKQDNGGSSSCKSTDMWRKYAEDFCAQKCSPETGKCGVNSFSNSEPCGQTTICGNGIVEGTEQCDDGNTVNSDGCDSLCKIESALSCVDSDGGRKEYIKAITTGFSVYPDEGYTSKGDYCIQKKIDGTFNLNTSLRDPYSAGQVSECTNNCAVMENSCSPANVIVADVINCPNGCSDGACKKWTTPTVQVSLNNLSTPYTATIGSQDVEMLSFSVAAAGGDIHLKGLTVDGSPSGTAFDNRIVRELRLYRDSISAANLLDTSNGGYIAAEKLAFDGAIDVTVSANSTQKFIVTASLVDDATQVGKTLQIGLSDIKLEDTSKNPVPVTSLPLISSRIATLAAGGKLFFEPESSDVSINSSKNILAGAVSPLLVAYKITATNEPIKIKDIIIRGTGTDFEKAVSEVIILGPDKTTEIARKSVSTSTINLNDMQYVVSPGSQNIYLKVVTRKIGKDEAGIQTGDLKVSLQIQSAEWDNSHKAIMPPTFSLESSPFAVVPVRISNIASVVSWGGTSLSPRLLYGSNNVAIISVTTDGSINTDSVYGIPLKTQLKKMQFTISKLSGIHGTIVGNYTIEKIWGTGQQIFWSVVSGSPLATWHGGVIEFDFQGEDFSMNNGTTSYYLVKANNVVKDVTNDEDDFIQLMIPALNNGQITYASDNANATQITDLRLPNVTSITGVEIHE